MEENEHKKSAEQTRQRDVPTAEIWNREFRKRVYSGSAKSAA